MRKKLNRLQWLDIVTGQGDRHAHNYLIDVREDLTVTGIDNDQCFTGYRPGAQTYVIKDRYAELFLEARDETIAKYPAYMRDVVRKRFEADPGVTILPGGSIRLEPTLFKSQEPHYATSAAPADTGRSFRGKGDGANRNCSRMPARRHRSGKEPGNERRSGYEAAGRDHRRPRWSRQRRPLGGSLTAGF